MTRWDLVLSCEHAGNRVPPGFQALFAGQEAVLATHRGYDLGILPLARRLSADFGVPLHACEITRLLVDTNRSRHSPTLFSEFSRRLPEADRLELLDRYYQPYRQAVTATVERSLVRGDRVLHLSLHSFTPVFQGRPRHVDVGLLYDPAQPGERSFCRSWRAALKDLAPCWRVRCNHPYRGVSDSLATTLRRHHADPERYLGIELEINQGHPLAAGAEWETLQHDLLRTLRETLAAWNLHGTPGTA
jgi:predicted N-formylglutamate amidohydrolase